MKGDIARGNCISPKFYNKSHRISSSTSNRGTSSTPRFSPNSESLQYDSPSVDDVLLTDLAIFIICKESKREGRPSFHMRSNQIDGRRWVCGVLVKNDGNGCDSTPLIDSYEIQKATLADRRIV